MSFPNANYNFNVVNEANLNSLVSNALSVAGDLSVQGNLNVGGNLTVNGSISPGTFTNRVAVLTQATGAILASNLTAAQSGTTFLIDGVGGHTVNLPTAAVGLKYKFVVGSTPAAAGSRFQLNTGNTTSVNFLGSIVLGPGNAVLTSFGMFAAGAADAILSFNGTTTGGILDSIVEVECIRVQPATGNSQCWAVTGNVIGSGTAATPFA